MTQPTPTPPSSRCKMCGKEIEQPFHTCLKPSSTPETDKASDVDNIIPGKGSWVFIDFARNLERGRDEARQVEKSAIAAMSSMQEQRDQLRAELSEAREIEKAASEVFNLRPINGMTIAETLRGIVKERDSLQSQLKEAQEQIKVQVCMMNNLRTQLSTLRKERGQ